MKTWAAILLIVLMLASVFGFVLNYNTGTSTRTRVNDHVFDYNSETGTYSTKINDSIVQFYYLPNSLQVNISDDFIAQLKNGQVTFTKDKNDTYINEISQIEFELSNVLFETNKIYVQGAYTTNETGVTATCENATQLTIYMHYSDEASVENKGNCLDIGILTTQEGLQYRDAILYQYNDII